MNFEASNDRRNPGPRGLDLGPCDRGLCAAQSGRDVARQPFFGSSASHLGVILPLVIALAILVLGIAALCVEYFRRDD